MSEASGNRKRPRSPSPDPPHKRPMRLPPHHPGVQHPVRPNPFRPPAQFHPPNTARYLARFPSAQFVIVDPYVQVDQHLFPILPPIPTITPGSGGIPPLVNLQHYSSELVSGAQRLANRMYDLATARFPWASVKLPLVSYSPHLPDETRALLTLLNIKISQLPFTPDKPRIIVRVHPYHNHWTLESASHILLIWLRHLN